jgi:hypothetical protein
MIHKPHQYLTGLEAKEMANGQVPKHAVKLVLHDVVAEVQRVIAQESAFKKNESESMMHWRKWTPRIKDAAPEQIADMEAMYEHIIVPPETLLGLIDTNDAARRQANNEMRYFAGFLHDDVSQPDRQLRNYLPPQNTCTTLMSIEDELLGFYTVKRDKEAVQKSMARLGWRPDVRYDRREHLPEATANGNRLEFSLKEYALEVFRAVKDGKVALPGVLVVSPAMKNDIMMRNLGQGKALKVETYRRLREKRIEYTLTNIYQVEAVALPDGPFIPISLVHNQNSEAINRDLGAECIALETEEFRRKDGIGLRVHWGIWASRVDELLRRADDEAPPIFVSPPDPDQADVARKSIG